MQRRNPIAASPVERCPVFGRLIVMLAAGASLCLTQSAALASDEMRSSRVRDHGDRLVLPSVSREAAPKLGRLVEKTNLGGIALRNAAGHGSEDGSKLPQRWLRIASSRGVRWAASSRCLNGRLKAAIYHVARTYGRVRVNSTCRGRRSNRRAGGARRSYHLGGNAADIRVWGNVRAAARYLRSIAGGYKYYGGGLFHIDTGPRRRW